MLIDVNGYLAATGLLYFPSAPTRLWDNRTNAFSGEAVPRKLPAGQYFRFNYGSPNVVLMLNITAVDQDAGGFITVYPCDQGLPNASNLNYQANEAIANSVLAKTDNSGLFCVYTTARLNFLIDLNLLDLIVRTAELDRLSEADSLNPDPVRARHPRDVRILPKSRDFH